MKIVLFFTSLLFCSFFQAQMGGKNSFAFLDLPYSARALALGSDFITAKDQDINLGVINPSLINDKMHNQASFSQALIAGGINYGQVNYARKLKHDLVGIAHLRYNDYGNFTRRDEFGNDLGSFKPMDLVLGASVSKPFSPKLSIGGTLNLIYSQLDSYSSFGASIDFSGNYFDEDKQFLITFLVKNAGYQLKGFTKQKHDALPLDVQLGVSKKLAHAPFRFSVLLHDLHRWDLSYNDPNAQPTIDALTGDTIPVPSAGFIEKIGRHFTFQTELLISKNLHLRAAFDLQKRQEMKLESRPGLSGFSFGVGMNFKKFGIDYGFGVASRAGFQHMISLTTNLNHWRK